MTLLSLLILAVSSLGQAEPGTSWYVNGRPAAADPSEASDGDFLAKMLVTADIAGFWREWQEPDPPQVSTTEEVSQGNPVHGIIIFGGCKAGNDGNCNVVVEFSLTNPSGTGYGESHRADAWVGPPAPGRNLQALPATLGFILEPQDPLGRYTIKAKVTDTIAGMTLAVEQAVRAVPPSDQTGRESPAHIEADK